MALFSDGAANDLEQLLAYDSGVLETARIEGIDLAVKLRLAWEELGIELKRYFVQRQRPELELRQVVVTEPLKKCHAFRALALTYRDAANQQRNDRYRERWKEWERQASWAWLALLDTGIGIVRSPIPRAEAPRVELVQLEAPAATYSVQVSWLGAGGSEGAPSEVVLVRAGGGQGLRVSPGIPPPEVLGWNVYVGYAGSEPRRQNAVRLELGESWVQKGPGLAPGPGPGWGQEPDYFLRRASEVGFDGANDGREGSGILWRG